MTKQSDTVRNVLSSDLWSIFKIGSAIVAIVMFIIIPQKEMEKQLALQAKDIATITGNHLTHIQDSIREIESSAKEHELQDIETQKELVKIQAVMQEILTILKK